MTGVPFIDLGGAEAVAEVARACEEIGFLTVTGHGVPAELVERMEAVSRAFFDLPGKGLVGGETPRLPVYRPLKREPGGEHGPKDSARPQRVARLGPGGSRFGLAPAGEKARYEPITAGEHVLEKARRAIVA